jgi:hypothetical protein
MTNTWYTTYMKWLLKLTPKQYIYISIGLIVLTAVILLAMGQISICKCGYIKLWHGVTYSSENSQHLTDWYTFSHIIHGFAFYFIFWLIGRWYRWPWGMMLIAAIFVEAAWEIFENTDMIINRYREVTISLDYYGDSVINSVFDILAMVAGFFAARKLPVWATILIIVFLEAFVGYMIRDNLTLNIIMLIFPIDAIREWQSAG